MRRRRIEDVLRRVLLAGTVALVAVAAGVAPAAGDVPQVDFYSCPGGGAPLQVDPAPHTDAQPSGPLDAVVTVPTSQPEYGWYQQVPVQVGNQTFDLVLDTGSSWMVINANAVADNSAIVPTGKTAAVSYGSGAACAAGPVVTAPVSVGGRAPRPVTFLLAETGNFPFVGLIGVNMWQPVASTLDRTLPALGITSYQVTAPATSDPTATGTWVINGQPDIDRVNPRRVATFTLDALAGGNRVYVPGVVTTGSSASGPVMLDIGTPENLVVAFPRTAKRLGYDFAAQTWTDPDAPVAVSAVPDTGPAFTLAPSVAPTMTSGVSVITSAQVADPSAGVTGLAGTAAIVGVDYVRPWILGVRLTQGGSVVRLAARTREPAQVRGCGTTIPPATVARRGWTRLLPGTCQVNGAPMQVKVSAQPVAGAGCGSHACASAAYRVVHRPNGSVWLRTFGQPVRLTVAWKAPAYLTHDPLRIRRLYRI